MKPQLDPMASSNSSCPSSVLWSAELQELLHKATVHITESQKRSEKSGISIFHIFKFKLGLFLLYEILAICPEVTLQKPSELSKEVAALSLPNSQMGFCVHMSSMNFLFCLCIIFPIDYKPLEITSE